MLSGGFSIWHWMIVLVLVIAVFGTKKLRNAGGDLGAAVRGFRSAMREGEAEASRDFGSGQLIAQNGVVTAPEPQEQYSSRAD